MAVADQRELKMYRNLLIQQANARKRKFLIGPHKRVNGAAISRATGISLADINRILRLNPSTRAGSEPDDWSPKGSTRKRIMDWLGYTSFADFDEALENAPEAPPPPPTNQKGKRKRAASGQDPA